MSETLTAPLLIPDLDPRSREFLKDLGAEGVCNEASLIEFATRLITADCWAVGVKRTSDSKNIEMLYNVYIKPWRRDHYWPERQTIIRNLSNLIQNNESIHIWMFGNPLTCWGCTIRNRGNPSIDILRSGSRPITQEESACQNSAPREHGQVGVA